MDNDIMKGRVREGYDWLSGGFERECRWSRCVGEFLVVGLLQFGGRSTDRPAVQSDMYYEDYIQKTQRESS